jgi:hypothetical protein
VNGVSKALRIVFAQAIPSGTARNAAGSSGTATFVGDADVRRDALVAVSLVVHESSGGNKTS